MPVPLLTVHDAQDHVHLILGYNTIANKRCQRSLDVGARPVVITPSGSSLHYGLAEKIATGQVKRLERLAEESDLTTLGRAEIEHVVDAVFITSGSESEFNTRIAARCRRLRVPVNVTDAPNLCTFTLPSLYSDGPLQIGITTSGMGCKLAARLRRQVLSVLPPNLGQGIQRLGSLRRRLIDEDHARTGEELSDEEMADDRAEGSPRVSAASPDSSKQRRLRWLSQICEHWPLERLANIEYGDIEELLRSYASSMALPSPGRARARIILAGSGPGSPHLLTVATQRAIETATVVLSDKLVPGAILDLIPRRTPVHIAEKFPGNADAAQRQLLDLGLQALQKGHTVLRLKQGDPYIYGRGGEEMQFFRAAGYEPLVLPAVTSALAAPLAAAIPLTHRGIADEVRICTGVGRKGRPPVPPGYASSQTVVVLMVLNRLRSFVRSLTGIVADESNEKNGTANGNVQLPPTNGNMSSKEFQSNGNTEMNKEKPAGDLIFANPPWPPDTPCAVIERASCPDQRVIHSTLRHVVAAFEEAGSQPPGLLVLGRACEVLNPRSRPTQDAQALETHLSAPGGDITSDGQGDAVTEQAFYSRFMITEGYSDLDLWMREANALLDMDALRDRPSQS